MSERTRRDLLAGLAAAAGLAGCTGLGGSGGARTDTSTPVPSRTPTATPSPSPTPGPDTLRLTRVDGVVDGRTVVHPELLRSWLVRAARSEGPIRVTATVPVPMPDPVLTRFEAVTLETGDEAVDGTYAVDCEGGTRYEVLVGAQSVESVPEDATVTPLSALAERRREVALAALGTERVTVYPETELGEWVREAWFGGYFRHDGTVYRGEEVRQTDAAFFSETLWMVLSLSSAPASNVDGPTLRFPELDPTARAFLDEALAGREKDEEEAERTVDALPESVRSFAAETDHLLTHTTAFEVAAVDLIG
jgi:hypothetical protein